MSKSIDGLQRRDQKSKPKTVRRVVKNTTVRRAEAEPIEKTVLRKEAKARERAEDKAVREFFDEVKDSDPTNLLSTSEDLPAKKGKKSKKEKVGRKNYSSHYFGFSTFDYCRTCSCLFYCK